MALALLVVGPRVAGAKSSSLVVSLDVPAERAPDYVCLVAHEVLKGVTLAQEGTGDDVSLGSVLAKLGGLHYTFKHGVDLSKLAPGSTADSIAAITTRKAEGKSCGSEDRDACWPDLFLDQFAVDDKHPESGVAGRIICSAQTGVKASSDPGARKRVAFLGLSFANKAKRSGISSITLYGTALTIDFAVPLTDPVVYIQAIGGDYVPRHTFQGTSEHVLVVLEPRCRHSTVQIDGDWTKLDSIKVAGKACTHEPSQPTNQLAALELAYDEGKRVDVSYLDGTTEEVTWTSDPPPSVLKLAIRKIAFSWMQPTNCFRDHWDDAGSKCGRTDFNNACPRASLKKPCTLLQSPKDRCDYVCELEPRFDAVAPPLDVQFDRMRLRDDVPEVVYSWHDQIRGPQEALTSIVAPADRHLMVDLQDPKANWRDHHGDTLDAIRVVSRDSSDQLDLTDVDKDPPRWLSFATPNRTCSESVRVAIFGSRVYNEYTHVLDAKTGSELLLTMPSDYRRVFHSYAIVGGTFLYRDVPKDVLPSIELGLGGRIADWWLLKHVPSVSLDVEFSGELGQTFYRGIQLPDEAPSLYSKVPYFRFQARTGLEWWWMPRWGGQILFGPSFGTPLHPADDAKVGTFRFSGVIEGSLVSTLAPRRIWLAYGLGDRFFEQHFSYQTDFRGEPAPTLTRNHEMYVFLRIKASL